MCDCMTAIGVTSLTFNHDTHTFVCNCAACQLSKLRFQNCLADDLSSEDGGSPTAVKGLVQPKEGKPGQSPSKGGG